MSDNFEAWARINRLNLSFSASGRLDSVAKVAQTRRVICCEIRPEDPNYGRYYAMEFGLDPVRGIRPSEWIGSDIDSWNQFMWGA